MTYKREHYAIQNATITPKSEQNPSIWIGADALKTVKRAAQIGDCWFASPSARKSHLRKLNNVYNEEYKRAGKDRPIAAPREAFVAPKAEDAASVAGPHLEAKYDQYAEWKNDESLASFFDLADERFFIGDPEEVAESIRQYERELDVDHLALRVHWPGMEHNKR